MYTNKLIKTILYELREGRYKDTEILPKEEELAQTFNVSRTALRDVLKSLEEEGYIIRVKKKGTIRNKRVLNLNFRIDIEYEFKDLLEIAGYEHSYKILDVEEIKADKYIAGELEIEKGKPLLKIKKLVFANKKPVILCFDFIDLCLLNNKKPEAKEYDPNIYNLVEVKSNKKIDFNITKILPSRATKEIRDILKLKGNVFKIEDVAFTKYAKPLLFSRIYWNGDFFDFQLVRKRY